MKGCVEIMIIKVERNCGKDRCFSMLLPKIVHQIFFFFNFSLLKRRLTLHMLSSDIYVPVEATKEKEKMQMLLPPVPCPGESGPRHSASYAHYQSG